MAHLVQKVDGRVCDKKTSNTARSNKFCNELSSSFNKKQLEIGVGSSWVHITQAAQQLNFLQTYRSFRYENTNFSNGFVSYEGVFSIRFIPGATALKSSRLKNQFLHLWSFTVLYSCYIKIFSSSW